MVHSIFNEVLGPIMTGPSSSHTAGCGRIGLTARSLYGKPVRRAEIVFDERGSYPGTYKGQGSDYGFAGGLLGLDIADPRFRDALKIAREQGCRFDFLTADLGAEHPNQAEIRIYEDNEAEPAMRLMSYSTGGGMFEIHAMDGLDVLIDGSFEQVFLLCDEEREDEVEDLIRRCRFFYDRTDLKGQRFFAVALDADQDSAPLTELRQWEGVRYVRIAEPVMPVPRNRRMQLPFRTAKEALAYGEERELNAADLAVLYETAYGSIDRERVYELAAQTEDAMRRSCVPPDPQTTELFGFLPYRSAQMRSLREELQSKDKMAGLLDAGLLNDAMLAAVAVMENSCAHNVVAAAPTAGSSGVLPGAIVAIADRMGMRPVLVREGLLAAGLVGSFIGNRATFAAEEAGCQAETGAASAMAAAGLAHMLGCGLKGVFCAASMALQNMLGLICDPVGGLTEIPCITRNVSAVSNAVMCANMAKLGFDCVIPLDECIEAMLDVGQQLPSELRCTCRGGLCTTKTGRRLQLFMEKMREGEES